MLFRSPGPGPGPAPGAVPAPRPPARRMSAPPLVRGSPSATGCSPSRSSGSSLRGKAPPPPPRLPRPAFATLSARFTNKLSHPGAVCACCWGVGGSPCGRALVRTPPGPPPSCQPCPTWHPARHPPPLWATWPGVHLCYPGGRRGTGSRVQLVRGLWRPPSGGIQDKE